MGVPQDKKQQQADICACIHTSAYLHTSTGLIQPIIIRLHTHTYTHTHTHRKTHTHTHTHNN